MGVKPSYLLYIVLLFIGLSLRSPPVAAQPCPHDGDVNQDASRTPVDALMAFQHFLEIIVLDACQQEHANVESPESTGITPYASS